MNRQHVKYLLAGGGIASAAAAQAIRDIDREGALLLVGAEASRPYHRPPLSKQHLRGQASRQTLAALDPDWCLAHAVQVRSGVRAARLDAARRIVTLDTGEEISFDQLLIATGATPAPLKIAGADLPGVFYLCTLADADRLHHAITVAKREGRITDRARASAAAAPDAPPPSLTAPTGRGSAAIIGGGLMGVELAASLRQLGLVVHLIVEEPHPWSGYVGESAGRFVTRFLEARGVHVHCGTAPQRLEGAGRVQRVVLRGGAGEGDAGVQCDFVVAAVGAVPQRELVRGTQVAAERAILTDEYGRTNVAGVWAAGDCAAMLDPAFAKHRVLDHEDHARESGTLAGRNMAAAQLGRAIERYVGVSVWGAEVFDLRVAAWGQAGFVSHRLLRGTPRLKQREGADLPGDFVEFGVAADGRLAQVVAVGVVPAEQFALYREMVRRRLNVAGKEELLKDPSADLAAIAG